MEVVRMLARLAKAFSGALHTTNNEFYAKWAYRLIMLFSVTVILLIQLKAHGDALQGTLTGEQMQDLGGAIETIGYALILVWAFEFVGNMVREWRRDEQPVQEVSADVEP